MIIILAFVSVPSNQALCYDIIVFIERQLYHEKVYVICKVVIIFFLALQRDLEMGNLFQ